MQTTTSTCRRRHICGALGIINLDDSFGARSQRVASSERCHCWHDVY